MKGIIIEETGGVEKLKFQEVSDHKLESGEVRVKHTAIGVNYIDIYYRTGLYKTALPSVLGIEAAGVVEEIGPNVKGFEVGERVAYGTSTTLLGAYCTKRNIPINQLVKLPDMISDEVAATIMVNGLTAHSLLRRVYPVQQGQTILIHAAAGGVGTYMTQWAKYLGCTVIGTVGSEEKRKWAEDNGCDHVINYQTEDFVTKSREITNGYGVVAVYDSVGKDTFDKSLQCLMPFGLMVSYGQSSGRVPSFDIMQLARGNLFLTRPTLNVYKHDYNELQISCLEVYEGIQSGALKPKITNKFPLQDAAKAHELLESRKSTGSIILIP